MFFDFLVEEQSAEAALKILVPKILPDIKFTIRPFRGKPDLIKKLPARLRAYSKWITSDYTIVVLVDRDHQDCHELKGQMETIAINARLKTRSRFPQDFQVVNRIAIEELEAWFFGDLQAIRKALSSYAYHFGE